MKKELLQCQHYPGDSCIKQLPGKINVLEHSQKLITGMYNLKRIEVPLYNNTEFVDHYKTCLYAYTL